MRYNYHYVLSVLETDIAKNELAGTELQFLLVHKEAFEKDYKQMIEFKERWDKIENHLRNLNQSDNV